MAYSIAYSAIRSKGGKIGCQWMGQANDPSESILSSQYLAQLVALSRSAANQQGQKWLNGFHRPTAIEGLS
jgi:hypothetical protein